MHKALLVSLAMLAAAPLSGQLVFTTAGAQFIDFQSDVGWQLNDPLDDGNDVVHAGGQYELLEENNNNWKSSTSNGGLSAEAWSWYRSVQFPTPTPFGDANGDSDRGDALQVNSVALVDLSGYGLGSGGDLAWQFGSGTPPNGTYADMALTLRVRNATGGAVSAWYFALDTWYRDTDTSVQTVTLLYSLDNAAYTPIAAYTTNNSAGAWTARPLGGNFNATVPDGAYLYLRMDYTRPGTGTQSGSALLWDNWQVVAAAANAGYTAPTTLTATPLSTSSIRLDWDDPNTGETGYIIERSLDGDSSWNLVTPVAPDTTTHTDTGLAEAVTCFYRVKATASFGGSDWSPVASATTLGNPPDRATGLVATAVNGTKIRLDWTDASTNESGFRIEAAASGSGPFTPLAEVPANTTVWFDHTLFPTETRHYRVVAINPIGEATPSSVAAVTTPLNSTVNFFVFANSFSHFAFYLQDLAQSMGDSVNIAIPRAGGLYTSRVLEALLGREAGTVPLITEAQALTMDPITAYDHGWAPLETNYNARVDVQALLDGRDWDVISWQAGSDEANNPDLVINDMAPGIHHYFRTLDKEPSARVLYYHTTPYPNDALLFRSPHNLGALRPEVFRGSLPYTEDQHLFDSFGVSLQVADQYGFESVPGGIAQENLRYDERWGIDFPDQSFDYFNATDPAEPYVPIDRRLHYGMYWTGSPQGSAGKVNWVIDAHPHTLLDYLCACLWYEELFRKDVRLSTYAPAGFAPETAALIREVAHRTAKGLLPPLRLADATSRLAYGDQLWARAGSLLASEDPGKVENAYRMLEYLYAYVPEHSAAQSAATLLMGAGRQVSAETRARVEAGERPVREAIFQRIWDSSAAGTPVDVALGPASDLDQDGIPALLEMKLGLNPLSRDANAGLELAVDSHGSQSWFVVRHRAAVLRSDVVLNLQTSEDLSPSGWNTIAIQSPVTQIATGADPSMPTVQIIETRIPATSDRWFIRIKAQ